MWSLQPPKVGQGNQSEMAKAGSESVGTVRCARRKVPWWRQCLSTASSLALLGAETLHPASRTSLIFCCCTSTQHSSLNAPLKATLWDGHIEDVGKACWSITSKALCVRMGKHAEGKEVQCVVSLGRISCRFYFSAASLAIPPVPPWSPVWGDL